MAIKHFNSFLPWLPEEGLIARTWVDTEAQRLAFVWGFLSFMGLGKNLYNLR